MMLLRKRGSCKSRKNKMNDKRINRQVSCY
jgi:hypothetical protein